MSVKRHAICGSLMENIRHVYDVTMLFHRDDIQGFLNDKVELKRLFEIRKKFLQKMCQLLLTTSFLDFILIWSKAASQLWTFLSVP